MPKHVKEPTDVPEIYPTIDLDDDHILRTVMKAFGRFQTTTIVTVYHTAYHNRDMTKWTALVHTKDITGMRYYELYHNGQHTFFLTI